MNRTAEFNVTALNEDELEESTSVEIGITEEDWQRMLDSERSFSVMNEDPALTPLTERVQKAAYDSGWIPFRDEEEEDEGFFALDFPSYIVDYPQEIVLANWRAKKKA